MSQMNRRPNLGGPGLPGSFLPEDYLRRKAETRAIVMSVALFVIVTMGVVGAFFVTFRQWNDVRKLQAEVNAQYAVETKRIEQLKALEQQRTERVEKGEVIAGLLERVPRSILLAELINRMPKQLTLTDLSLKSKRITEAPAKPGPKTTQPNVRSLAQGRSGAPEKAAPPRPVAPRFEFKLELTGLSGSDEEVADYHRALTECPLLERVEMMYSGEVVIDEVPMRKFRIEASIRGDADARHIEPLHVPRLPGMAALGVPGAAAENDMDPTRPRQSHAGAAKE